MNNRRLYNNNFTITIISSPLIPSCYIIIIIIKSAICVVLYAFAISTPLSLFLSLSLKIKSIRSLRYIPPEPPPLLYCFKTTWLIILVASTYRSVHCSRHFLSYELNDDDGFETHNLKHFSRTVVKNSCAYAFASSAWTWCMTSSG